MLLGQIMLIVGVAGTLIQVGRWISKRHVTQPFAYFVITIAVIVAMQTGSILLFNQQAQQISDLESQNRVLNLQQIASQNLTIANQALIKYALKETHDIEADIHFHITNASKLDGRLALNHTAAHTVTKMLKPGPIVVDVGG